MKKTLLTLSLLVLAVFLAFASGDEEASDDGGGMMSNIDPPAQATVIDMIGWAFPITEFYAEELETLNAVENLTVNTQLLNNQGAQDQVRLALSGGKESPYEIVHAANSQISEWGFADWLLPLNDLIDKYRDEYDLDDIPQTLWDAATVDGDIVGIPIVSNTLFMIYRADLFEEYGIDVPQTYDDVIEAAQILEADNTIDLPFTMNLHAGWAWEIEYLAFVRSFGGDFLDENNMPAFTGPEGVAALEKMIEVSEAMGDVGMSYSIDDSEIGLQTGRLAFANIWASRAVNMNNAEVSAYPDDIAFAPAAAPRPGGARGGSAWNDFYCIPKTTPVDPELIFQVIMEAVDLESQQRAVEFGIPSRTEAVESDLARPYMPAAMATLAEGVGAYPNTPALGLVRTALANALPLAGSGDLTPKEALDMAAADYLEQARAQGFVE